MRLWNTALCAVVIVACGLASAAAQTPTMSAGETRLTLVSRATRSEMFGLVDLYEVALYVPPDVSSLAMLRGQDTAKGLRVEIEYDGSLPDRIPTEWSRELQPALSRAQQQELRRAYAGLGPGDVIEITYAPGAGTRIVVSGDTVLTDRGYEVMAAFMNIWLGQTPVSEDVKQQLLTGF